MENICPKIVKCCCVFFRLLITTIHFLLWLNSIILVIKVVLAVNVLWVNSVFLQNLFIPTAIFFLAWLLVILCTCGAVKLNHHCFRGLYGFLFLVCLIEMLIGLYVYYITNIPPNIVRMKMEHMMSQYKNDTTVAKQWDSLQEEIDCCGIKNATDWIKVIGHLPASCCHDKAKKCEIENASHYGCESKAIEFLRSNNNLGLFLFSSAVIQALLLSVTVASNWPNNGYTVI